ncbi:MULTISPECIES: FHA domain-containing protein [Clostridium]|uniref:FHA domain-containing protein n=1 Tax=Clostridium butyricum TaxID=1492 RepID=A0AAP9UFW8_CLOBU|nr:MULTISPECIES: FHA domain-containing protein [Clostridium]MDU4853177.1 FHA domain-containing protein [Clostridioides difficile]EMU55367.1 hypothetical protein CBDKU1_07000 [Clostridium butyricum DKU-01]KJZ84863.1 hypothetical protein ClosIBUN22A_CONTIG82g01861 [Clostridium sp. IBUN22A]KJZ87330.1 hypothetical protein ClosIBUN125C_CONTIG34g01935 [Clostridium sp. IBUN125C]KJZ89740.1 hypothetical protein ClosIBUN62F_CONTIG57g02164 [Clostridium sp. IBUN62F]
MYENNSIKKKLYISMQMINVLIAVIMTLLCIIAYYTIEYTYARALIIGVVIVLGTICLINIYIKFQAKNKPRDFSRIKTVELVNEDNDIVSLWNIEDKTSLLIGKNTKDEKVNIDLNSSIYSNLVDDKHAVLNYAAGKWFVEDLSSEYGVRIKKRDDDIIYRLVNDTPCEIKCGDILYIAKIKLLLK